MKLILKKDWIGPKGVLYAGEYAIPRKISLAHAKCARADGAGEIERDASPAPLEAAVAAPTVFPDFEHKEQAASPTPTPEPARTLTSTGGRGKSSR
ncbi:MAG TPA: hypothetical protein VMT30_02345 [Candidatus Saccharimonadia bacterium]|nr:hypothetical protein [Candidatus Saccharimonadia bacterium]